MTEVVNLRIARKRAKRKQGEARSASNRLAHGQPKSKRKLAVARQQHADRHLDQHLIEKGDGR